MTIRTLVDSAIADVMAEHPKYFTPRGHESARNALLQKIMKSLRDDMKEQAQGNDSTAESKTEVGIPTARSVHKSSREAQAYTMLRLAGGAVPVRPFESNGQVLVPAEAAIPAVWAFADAPKPEKWGIVATKSQIAAWLHFFNETLPGIARRNIFAVVNAGLRQEVRVPWPWPPNKDGSIHEPAPVDESVDELVDFE